MKLQELSFKRHVCLCLILAAVALSGICVVAALCGRKTMSVDEASKWIAAYAPYHVDMDATIRIELTDSAMARLDAEVSPDRYFSFSPRVKGTAVVSADRRFVDFVPTTSLEQGREYRCRIDMAMMTGIDSLADFAFDFHVDRRTIRIDNVKAVVAPYNTSMMTVTGRLKYSTDAGDSLTMDSSVIACNYPDVKIRMDGKAVHGSRGFCISGIRRTNKAGSLKLSVNPIGGFSATGLTVAIPSISDFSLMEAERVEAAEPYLNLEFSSPLSTQQEMDGLITIDSVGDVRLLRSGTNVKVFYPRNGIRNMTLRVSDMVKNSEGRILGEEVVRHFEQEVIPPAIEIPIDGSILPDDRNLKLPFRAVNLAAVDVEVVKIYPANVMSFLQTNSMDDYRSLRRYGRLVYRRTVRLDRNKSLNLHQWQNFSIDLRGLFAKERGAIYNVRLVFRKAYSLYGRTAPDAFDEIKGLTEEDKATWSEEYTYIYRACPDTDWYKYDWREADDPSKDSYYMVEGRMPEVNLVASDLGLIVKRADDSEVKAVVTNIGTAMPAAGIRVRAYNFQLQEVGSGVTGADGFADFKTRVRPFMVTASDGRSTTYLKVGSRHELSTSTFEVSGRKIKDGIKGFVYGERGVVRPGDDIHLTLIVEDKNRKLPDNHPVVLELYNPLEQLYARQTLAKGTDGFYVFHVPTEESVPTGMWKARFKVGNETFNHAVRVETITPNRLKIDIKASDIIRANRKERVGLAVRWLTGPVAAGMSASVEMALYPKVKAFEKYSAYRFTNPLLSFESSQKELFFGRLDSLGNIVRDCTVGAGADAPGLLQANVTAKVMEPGGNASIVSKSLTFSPFAAYVGIDLDTKLYETDEDINFPVLVLDEAGTKLKERELDYKIYRLDWEWWWEGSADDLSRYVQSTTADVVARGKVKAVNGVAGVPFKVEYPDCGRYLVIVRDTKGGHATGGVVTVDWPEWRGRSTLGHNAGSRELSFTLDKSRYEVGETANVYLPKCKGGRVLLSIETGARIVKRTWVQLSGKEETRYRLHVDKDMAPNFYVSATMLRPHKDTDFDTPLRLFGIQTAKVVNPKSILHPLIDMPDELCPQRQFTVRIKETDNKPMTYTLAIVDEGLLDITGFRTPRPWAAMNVKEALGVRTWDMFDDVVGAFGAGFRSILSVGGDEALRRAAGKEKRFNPAVVFLGPFTLRGGTKSHRISLPNYVGSVRVMVVAAHNGTYGSADKTVKVTSPLMLLPTVPRTLACCDTVEIPVNVFAMEDGMKTVKVSVEAEGPVKVSGRESVDVAFETCGERMTAFRLVCDKARTGKARIVLTASGNGHVIRDTTYVDVSNPMPLVLDTKAVSLPGEGVSELTWTPMDSGIVSLQVASMPTLNFNGVFRFMDGYSHQCTEQLSSKAIFMLFGRGFLGDDEARACERHLPRIIKAIQSRQTQSGGFVYWPGQTEEDAWVTSMAGIALSEASRQGFRIGHDCLERWNRYQEAEARHYRYSPDTDVAQAFRLYSLAIAESPLASAMNRLRESARLSRTAAYCLASAYAESGRKDVAMKLTDRAEASELSEGRGMFRFSVLDDVFGLEAYARCGTLSKAMPAARRIARNCSGSNYVTQDVALATLAMSRLKSVSGNGKTSVRVSEPGCPAVLVGGLACPQSVSLAPRSGRVRLENTGEETLEVSLLTSHRPSPDSRVEAKANGMKMTVSYHDAKGNPLSVSRLKQETEFTVRITVSGLREDVDNMALTYTVPSGWEIWNNRLHGGRQDVGGYVDIRDSSYRRYFAMRRGETKRIELRLRAAYPGHYLLPSVVCEDMYNPSCVATTSSGRVMVTK